MAGLNHQAHRLRVAQIARSFQSIPIKMKSPTSVRKVTLMIATVRNTSLAERGFMNASHLAKPPGVNHSGQKKFRFQTQKARDARGAGIRGGLRQSPVIFGLGRALLRGPLYPDEPTSRVSRCRRISSAELAIEGSCLSQVEPKLRLFC